MSGCRVRQNAETCETAAGLMLGTLWAWVHASAQKQQKQTLHMQVPPRQQPASLTLSARLPSRCCAAGLTPPSSASCPLSTAAASCRGAAAAAPLPLPARSFINASSPTAACGIRVDGASCQCMTNKRHSLCFMIGSWGCHALYCPITCPTSCLWNFPLSRLLSCLPPSHTPAPAWGPAPAGSAGPASGTACS